MPRGPALVTCALALALAGRARAADAPLSPDPALVRGHLGNGLAYWIRPQRAPGDRVAIWLRVGSGSLEEAPDQRGLAHLIEHLAFRSTLHFPDGQVTPFLEALGLAPARDENAYTRVRDTTYELLLPDGRRETLEKALMVLGDFAFRRRVDAAAIERERQVVLQEMRDAEGPEARIERQLLPRLFPHTALADHQPLGSAAIVRRATPSAVARYLTRWYRPDRSAILVAGQVDPALVVRLVNAELGAWRAAGPPPREALPRVRPFDRLSAAVIGEPEVPAARLRATAMAPLVPVRTQAELRQRLVDEAALWILGDRLQQAVLQGTTPLTSSLAQRRAPFALADEIVVQATARPGEWREGLRALLFELDRLREHGVTAAELAAARRALLVDRAQAASGEETRDPRATLAALKQALESGAVPISRAQERAAAEALLRGVAAEEVGAAARARLRPDGLLVSAVLPGATRPRDADLLAVAAGLLRVPVPAPPPLEPIERLLEHDPTPGTVADLEEVVEDGVTTATLSNGVRVHLRPMADRPDQVLVWVSLAGGELLETPATRGVTAAAAVAFSRPATGRVGLGAFHEALRGRDVRLSGCACEPDVLTVKLRADADDVEEGMRALHLLLADARVDPAALRGWRERRLAAVDEARADPELRASARVDELLSGGDARVAAAGVEQWRRIDADAAQRWLDRHLRAAPMEVAIVGDLPRERMMELALTYLGSLPARTRDDPSLAWLRRLPRPAGPLAATVVVPGGAPRAVAEIGWRGPERADAADAAALDVAARVLTDRLMAEVRARRGLVYGISCDSLPADALEGLGTFSVGFSAAPAMVGAVASLSRQIVEDFVRAGPTPEELDTAVRQLLEERRADERDPRYWAERLSTLDLRGPGPPSAPRALATTPPSQSDVREALRRYAVEARRYGVVATPATPPLVARRGAGASARSGRRPIAAP